MVSVRRFLKALHGLQLDDIETLLDCLRGMYNFVEDG